MEDGELIGPPKLKSWRCVRVFFMCIFAQKKNDVPARGQFHDLGRVLSKKRIFPKMTQKCPGVVGEHPRPILEHVRPMLTKIHSKFIIIKIHIESPIWDPFLLKVLYVGSAMSHKSH